MIDRLDGASQTAQLEGGPHDDVVFVDELPHTATGKINKLELREQFKDYKFPGT